ncbi:hypothetical protein GCM10010172_10450 [Paractinoplanes ferrugineus]|uniref:PASTA domain-containing protein n=1 Tax=Paractinoplanes ferrugineus TaxID=113564 RepID=A0A919IZH9_9ACTN|nr:hypothetical protein Afe05nite_14490 [Actinoplanes ferrugineus]
MLGAAAAIVMGGVVTLAAPVSAQAAGPAGAAVTATTVVPYVLNDPAVLAAREIRDAGLQPVVNGRTTGAYVISQSPVPGRVVPVGTTVTIRTVVGPTP